MQLASSIDRIFSCLIP